jgi:hypothetical protein
VRLSLLRARIFPFYVDYHYRYMKRTGTVYYPLRCTGMHRNNDEIVMTIYLTVWRVLSRNDILSCTRAISRPLCSAPIHINKDLSMQKKGAKTLLDRQSKALERSEITVPVHCNNLNKTELSNRNFPNAEQNFRIYEAKNWKKPC